MKIIGTWKGVVIKNIKRGPIDCHMLSIKEKQSFS